MVKQVGNSELLDTWAGAAAGPDIVAAPSLKKDAGWLAGEKPPNSYFNQSINELGQKINHILQNGIPIWNATTTYVIGDLVGHSNEAWLATGASTNAAPPSANWKIISSGVGTVDLFDLISNIRTKGCGIANNATDLTNDIDFLAGVCVADNLGILMRTAATQVKQLDATWVAGTNAGGRFATVSLSTSAWYHCYRIINDTTGAVDHGFDTSVTAANRPAGWSNYKRLGSIFRDGSGIIRRFYQSRTEFYLTIPIVSVTYLGVVYSNVSRSMDTPEGIQTLAILKPTFTDPAGANDVEGFISVVPVGSAGFTPTQSTAHAYYREITTSEPTFLFSNNMTHKVLTNTTRQVSTTYTGSGTAQMPHTYVTFGWDDFLIQ